MKGDATRQRRLTAALLLLLLLTACSQGAATPPGDPPASPSQAPVTTTSPAPAPANPSGPAAPEGTPVPVPPGPPVLSESRAVYLVEQTAEAQELKSRLGSRLVRFLPVRTGETYSIPFGEQVGDRTEMRLTFTVNRADATVNYANPATGQWERATRRIPPVHPAAKQADELLGRGDLVRALELLNVARDNKPTADVWNLLSYIYLQKGQWQSAADAGEQALALDRYHPYALYNTGIAQLELKESQTAIRYLLDAGEMQPDRPEPYLGLARAYVATRQHALAADAVATALRLAPANQEATQLQAAVAAMVKQAAPPDLKSLAKVRLEDGPYTISLVPGEDAVVYLQGPEGVTGLPVGEVGVENWSRFVRLSLPDGSTGYLLQGRRLGAEISGSVAGRLFIRQPDGSFRQMLFTGSDEPALLRVSDLFRAGASRVTGDRLVTTYGHDATREITITETWQLNPAEAKALLLERTEKKGDPNK